MLIWSLLWYQIISFNSLPEAVTTIYCGCSLIEIVINWLDFVIQSAYSNNFSIRQSTLSSKCRLDRRNLQWSGVLDLSRQPKISWFNFLVDLKKQSTHQEKNIGPQQCFVALWFYGTPGRILKTKKYRNFNRLILHSFFNQLLVSFGTV